MKYVIADSGSEQLWSHLFEEDGGVTERTCRFVYDREDEELHALRILRDEMWTLPTRSEMQDLEDSLKGANPESLGNPVCWGLRVSSSLPDWAGNLDCEAASTGPGM